MYESKATLRTEFESFQTMFLLLGGLIPTAMHKQAMKYSVVERLRDAE